MKSDTFGNIPYNVEKKKIPETSHQMIYTEIKHNISIQEDHMAQWWQALNQELKSRWFKPLWSLDFVCCALNQGPLSILPQSTEMILGTGLCWD